MTTTIRKQRSEELQRLLAERYETLTKALAGRALTKEDRAPVGVGEVVVIDSLKLSLAVADFASILAEIKKIK